MIKPPENVTPRNKPQVIEPDDENHGKLILDFVINKELGLSFIDDFDNEDVYPIMFVLIAKCLYFIGYGTDATPEKAHDLFLYKMKRNGWVHGAKVDINNKKHPDMTDWKNLSSYKRNEYGRIADLVQEAIEYYEEKGGG